MKSKLFNLVLNSVFAGLVLGILYVDWLFWQVEFRSGWWIVLDVFLFYVMASRAEKDYKELKEILEENSNANVS